MSGHATISRFQELIETVEALPPDEQETLVEIIHLRLAQGKRAQLIEDVAQARDAFKRGDVRRGSAADLMAEVDQSETEV